MPRRRGPPGPGWSTRLKALATGQLGGPASASSSPEGLVGLTPPPTLDHLYSIPARLSPRVNWALKSLLIEQTTISDSEPPASDWSVVRIYPSLLRPVGPS
eukprot:1196426-Prorocentrum_minimum.AAC.3